MLIENRKCVCVTQCQFNVIIFGYLSLTKSGELIFYLKTTITQERRQTVMFFPYISPAPSYKLSVYSVSVFVFNCFIQNSMNLFLAKCAVKRAWLLRQNGSEPECSVMHNTRESSSVIF